MNEKNYPIDTTLNDVVEKKCPILQAMEVIGSKYKLPLCGTYTKKTPRATTNSSGESPA